MGYAAARGGQEAIEAAEKLVRKQRLRGRSRLLDTDQLVERQRLAVDRVMGEGGLWDPELAAVALRQAEGDVIEAAHLLRAYRSTLPRLGYSEPVEADELRVLRRIVPAYQKPPGPQLLGRTTDYSGRLIELDPGTELQSEEVTAPESAASGPVSSEPTYPNSPNGSDGNEPANDRASDEAMRHPTRLYEVLRAMDLVVDRRRNDRSQEPFDVTRRPAQPPAPRSARLAVMARAETGALVNLWYRNILGPDGYLHEVTLGEVRHGWLPVPVRHPHTGGTVRIGRIRATEVEAIEDLDGPDEPRDRFDVGYGLVMGHNERKAIAMANLDIACHRDGGRTQLEQSLLLTTDGLDASGFLEHLKLPHYVTFRSMVERKLAVRKAREAGEPEPESPARTTAQEGDRA